MEGCEKGMGLYSKRLTAHRSAIANVQHVSMLSAHLLMVDLISCHSLGSFRMDVDDAEEVVSEAEMDFLTAQDHRNRS